MHIFRAINNLSMGVTLPERDREGKVLKVHKVEFSGGQISPKFIGGSLATKNPKHIELLENSKRNKKNGGADWYLEKVIPEPGEEKAKTAAEPSKPKPAAAVLEPVAEPVLEPVVEAVIQEPEPVEEPAKPSVTDYPDITINQMAVNKLRELDPSLKVAELRNQAKIHEAAARLNVSFSNL